MSIASQQEAEQPHSPETKAQIEHTLPGLEDSPEVHPGRQYALPNPSFFQQCNSGLSVHNGVHPDDMSHSEAGFSSSSSSPASPTDNTNYCHKCNPPRAFQKKHQLTTHQRRHDPRFVCKQPQCDKRFQYRKDLTRHIQTVHDQDTKCFPCPNPSCQWSLNRGHKGFKRPDTLRRHLRIVHQTSSLSPTGNAS
jgi:hypothetical protein